MKSDASITSSQQQQETSSSLFTEKEFFFGLSGPESPKVFELQELKALCVMLHRDTVLLNNEIQVFKAMLKQSKSKNIVDLYFESLLFQQAFQLSYHFL
jgi:hypothetical protein